MDSPTALGSKLGGERLLTIREVAQLLHTCEKTVRRLVARKALPCVRVGAAVRFLPSDVFRWLQARKET